MQNPFIISTYKGPDYFCDRQSETKQLETALRNGRNIVLISLRRMGKTGLIKHLFYKLKTDKKVHTIYLDIMNTKSSEDFVNKLAEAVLKNYHSKSKRLFEKVLKFFTKFNPVITFDALTGIPSIEIKPHSEEQAKRSISTIFNYLEDQNKHIFIAIDEFQQVTNYVDANFETYLRSHIQHLNNINFIYSGSQQHLLTAMFSNYSRPFYQSSDFLKLERIEKDIYADFIIEKFAASKRKISKEMVLELLNWADGYTFYVQNLFNKLWYISKGSVSIENAEFAKQQLIDERHYIYLNLHNLLTKVQYGLLEAIAKNNGIDKPMSKEFINTYSLGTPSTVKTALDILISKEIVYKEISTYHIYDVFLLKWIQNN
jgi:AAA+ ATPase superfamily predicted ATPase